MLDNSNDSERNTFDDSLIKKLLSFIPLWSNNEVNLPYSNANIKNVTKSKKLGSWKQARNHSFAKGGGLNQKSNIFCSKNISFRPRSEQTGATQVYHRLDVRAEPPVAEGHRALGLKSTAAWRFLWFLRKSIHFNIIWITFRWFLEPLIWKK